MAPTQQVFKCPICSKNVTKSQRSVGCCCCGLFYHIDCVKITIEEHKFLLNHKALKYLCPSCPGSYIKKELEKGLSSLSSLEKDFDLKWMEYKRMFQEKLEDSVNVLKTHISELTKQCFENKSQIKDFKSDINNCCNLIKHVDTINADKIRTLETQSNSNLRRLNRSNIIIRGLPKSITDLRVPVIKIGSLCMLLYPTLISSIAHTLAVIKLFW